jgi:hypothetical protein
MYHLDSPQFCKHEKSDYSIEHKYLPYTKSLKTQFSQQFVETSNINFNKQNNLQKNTTT